MCFGSSRRPPTPTTTTIASDLDMLPGANAKRKKKKGGLYPGEAQRDLGVLSLGEGGLLGSTNKKRTTLFG